MNDVFKISECSECGTPLCSNAVKSNFCSNEDCSLSGLTVVNDFLVSGTPVVPSSILFSDDGEESGRLDMSSGRLEFTGNADESAKILFKHVTDSFNSLIDKSKADAILSVTSLPYSCETPTGDIAWGEDVIQAYADKVRIAGSKKKEL